MDSSTLHLYDKCFHFLSFRPRTVFEMKTYLKKNQATEKQIVEIIKKLNDLRFLNDLDFSQRWVEDRKKSHPRSLSVLKIELRQKGISDEIIKEVLIPQKAENQDLTMAKSIINKIISKSGNSINKLPSQELKNKLISRLQSKGFSWEIIKTAIDETFGKE